MKRALSLAGVSSRLLSLVLITLAAGSALAQPDPPGRVARLHHAQGTLAFALAGDAEWTEAAPNRPLLPGDRLWTDRGSRGELHLGSTALRLDGQTQLAITTLDDHAVQLNLGQGTVQAHVRELADGENFEIDTPNLALRALEEGDFRVDVDAVRGLTRVTVQSGTAMVYGEGGQSQPLGAGQQVQFRGRGLVTAAAQEAPPLDAFDRWAAERDRREEQSIAARHVPRALTGYLALDAGGDWSRDATHGSVWMPRLVSADWAPFRQGHWEWIMPWGWTWVDDAPWGFATSHYGRWTRIGTRWAWVPGRLPARPVYAPELVGFLKLGAGQRAGLAWFPLAPGEPWRPAYSASPVYLGKLNRPIGGADTPAGGLAHQRRPEALSALPLEQFQHGRPIAVTAQKFAGAELARAALAAAPGEPERLLATPRQRAPQPALAAAQAPVGPVAATPAALPAAALPAAAIPAQALMAATPVPATPGQSLTITREQVQGQIAQPEQAAPQQAEQAQRHKEAAPNDPVAKEQVAKAQVSSEQPQKERVAQKPPTPKVLAAKPQPQRDQQQQKLQAQRELQQKQALAQRQQAARSQASRQAAEQAQRAGQARRDAQQVQRELARLQAEREAARRQAEQQRRALQVRRDQDKAQREREARLLAAQREAQQDMRGRREAELARHEAEQAQARRAERERELARQEAAQREQAQTEQSRREQEQLQQRLRQQAEERALERARAQQAAEQRARQEAWQRQRPVPLNAWPSVQQGIPILGQR